MAQTSTLDSPLIQLQSRSQVELLDAIDRLRLDEFQGELDLPQLIVCGDQSSGKSSVLEAISGVRFPASDVFCTRFASELILRRAPTASISVRIEPAPSRSETEKKFLLEFQPSEDMSNPADFAAAISGAASHIDGLDGSGAFFEDKLIAVVRGPDLPLLTLVDLPGLIHASNKEQGAQDIVTVKKIVESYMAVPGSIILAVLAADNNFANQIVLQLAKTHDPQAQRTLGIITKPDRIEAGSKSEASCIEHLQNRNVYLELGWHVLRNRGFEHADASPDERNALEATFFLRPVWDQLPDADVGVVALRTKLSRVLLERLYSGLPALVNDIKARITTCEAAVAKLGKPKTTEIEQRVQLIEISRDLHRLIEGGVNASYRDSFFDDRGKDDLSAHRLRSRLRDNLDQFSTYMHANGHSYDILQGPSAATKDLATTVDFSPACRSAFNRPVAISSSVFVQDVERKVHHNRGRELDGMSSPDTVAELFRMQSAAWQSIGLELTKECYRTTEYFVEEALEHVAAPHIKSAIMTHYITARMQAVSERLDAKVKELSRSYQRGKLIALDTARLRDFVDSARKQRWTLSEAEDRKCATSTKGSSEQSTAAALESIDYMQAYYQIALRTFIDNVATLAVENCLVDGLMEVFNPVVVASFDSSMIELLTLEPMTVRRDRETNRRRLSTLRGILRTFEQHNGSLAANFGESGVAQSTKLRRNQETFVEREKHSKTAPVLVNVSMPYTPPRTPISGRSLSVSSSSRSKRGRSSSSLQINRSSKNNAALSPSPSWRQPSIEDERQELTDRAESEEEPL